MEDLARHHRRALECLIGIPGTEGNRVDVLRNGAKAFPAMLEAVGQARRTIDLQTFAHWSGEIGQELAAALAERARAGVRVRVLLDSLGARHIDRGVVTPMASAGVEVEWFRPLTNWRVTQSSHRGHRKVLVCDGEVGFTGGVGIADRWQGDARDPGEWRDTNVRVRGPAVNGLRGAFINNWAETGRPLFDEEIDPLPVQPLVGPSWVQVVRGEAETGWGDTSTLVHALIGLARHSLRISAAYFVPDASAVALLAAAKRRGVHIRLLRPGPHAGSRLSQLASEAQYETLMEAGVRIFAFQPTALHAKTMSVDGVVAAVGAINFNSRSLTLDDEITFVVADPAVVATLDEQFDADSDRAQAVDRARWNARKPQRKLLESPPGFLARRL
jgi:cardiolipin synthase